LPIEAKVSVLLHLKEPQKALEAIELLFEVDRERKKTSRVSAVNVSKASIGKK
jgi:hypothetical protein